MDFHLDRQLRLKGVDEITHKGLYQSAIFEVDEREAQVGQDMIPWGWTTSFTATELSISDSILFESKDLFGRDKPEIEIGRRHVIHAKLRPGDPRQPQALDTTYRMFGTDRVIRCVTLDILPTADATAQGCTAWGSASYTTEIDFVNDTTEDILCFYLQVGPDVFDRYIWNLGQRLANELVLSVGFVEGFYSEWSPGVTTREIKVLAGHEHQVVGADGIELQRLGNIGKAEFFMNARNLLQPDAVQAADEEQEQRGFRWLRRHGRPPR